MLYVAGRGAVYGDIFNIYSKKDIAQRVVEWHKKSLGWCTDERMLTKYVREWSCFNDKCTLLGYGNAFPRVHRSLWRFHPQLVKDGRYVDAHLFKPYYEYKKEIDELVDLLHLFED